MYSYMATFRLHPYFYLFIYKRNCLCYGYACCPHYSGVLEPLKLSLETLLVLFKIHNMTQLSLLSADVQLNSAF